jgi:hypothetical protein
MIIALYKNKQHTFNRLVSWWTKGPYSHCELIFSDGMSASSSFRDKGARVKRIGYKPANWDFIVLPSLFNESQAREWFTNHAGIGYDVLGIAGFVVGALPESKGKAFCSESLLLAIGFKEAYRFYPNHIAPMLMADVIRGEDFNFTKYGVPRDDT